MHMSCSVLENPFCLDSRKPDPVESPYHQPVLVREVLSFLQPLAGRTFLDGTLGGGGHTESLLEGGAHVVAIDQDVEAIAHAGARLAHFGTRFQSIEGNFADATRLLDGAGIVNLHGALLDLGVSSHQLDDGSRGFSFRFDGPLDMRMSPKIRRSAADWVNEESTRELSRIFLEYGEEPRACQIAQQIARAREKAPILTTTDLLRALESILPRHSSRHPATRVFMALRIAVNDELGVLSRGLEAITERLSPGAHFAVITFHSLEDRIVKNFFKDRSREWLDRPEWPAPRRNPECFFRLLTARPIEAAAEEVHSNPRARSAKLRVAERL